ncbi:MAG: efflux RND transporter periplasmic adaptor subunit [Patescibacteria group bacterium]
MNKKRIVTIGIVLLVVFAIGSASFYYTYKDSFEKPSLQTLSSSVRFVNSTVSADGIVIAQNQAVLHFQTGGKLIYLPFKEGSKISIGQTIASIDSYTLQKQLEAALNTYRIARNNLDQSKDNASDNVQKAQMTYPYDYYSKAGLGDSRENAINEAVKRIVDQNQANLDNSVINVQLANYAFQLSSLTSPLTGILLKEDVNMAGVNITPATSFVVADPQTAVFRANVPVTNINYVAVGSAAEVAIDGLPNRLTGTVVAIYPSKVTLPNGQVVFQVDIQSDQILKSAKLDQTGTTIIKTNSENVALVPAWTVLGGKYIWTDANGTPKLKEVVVGKIYDKDIEILGGLTPNDKVITDPKYISSLKYKIL